MLMVVLPVDSPGPLTVSRKTPILCHMFIFAPPITKMPGSERLASELRRLAVVAGVANIEPHRRNPPAWRVGMPVMQL